MPYATTVSIKQQFQNVVMILDRYAFHPDYCSRRPPRKEVLADVVRLLGSVAGTMSVMNVENAAGSASVTESVAVGFPPLTVLG